MTRHKAVALELTAWAIWALAGGWLTQQAATQLANMYAPEIDTTYFTYGLGLLFFILVANLSWAVMAPPLHNPPQATR